MAVSVVLRGSDQGLCLPKEGGQASQLVPSCSSRKRIFRENNIAALVFPKGFAIYIVLSHTSGHMTLKTPREKSRASIVVDAKMKAQRHTGRKGEKPGFSDAKSSALCSSR